MKTKIYTRKLMSEAFSLIKQSLSVLLLFELIYKLAAAYVVMPLGSFLVSTSLKLAGINYITTENFMQALLNPLVVISVFLVLIMITAYTIFEISFLTLAFNQGYQKKPLGFIRMLGISARDAVRVFQPKNYLLILFIIVVIPVSNSVMVSSLIGGVEIPNYMMEVIWETPLYLTGIVLLMLVLLLIIIRYMFLFHVYTLEDKSVRSAGKEAVNLARGHKIKSLWVFFLWQMLSGVVIFFVVNVVLFIQTQVSMVFAENQALFTLLLTLNTSMKRILSFLVPSAMVLAGYSMISALFFTFREISDKDLPDALDPLEPNRKKENLRIFVVVTAVCLVSVVGMAYSNAHSLDLGASEKVLVMAHRGSSDDVPENTIPAFQKAIDLKADYIELDVQETKDGEIVVTHDSNFVRCTGVNANVWNLTLKDVETLDAGLRFREYSGTKVPTLREVLELCKGKIRLNIELKSNGHEKNLEKSVANLITEYEMDDEVVITSLTKKCLVKFKAEKPEIPAGYIVSMAVGNYLDVSWSDFYSVEQSFITENLVKDAHKRGKTINAWTISSPDEVEKMISLGADSIITGDPFMAREIILSYSDPFSRLMYSIGEE